MRRHGTGGLRSSGLHVVTVARCRSSAFPGLKRCHASTLASSTAVNAVKIIPPNKKRLHEALIDLQKKAPAAVNLSRLGLAIHGLESERSTIRIALLGLDVATHARRLTRLLLADSSKPQQNWETQVLNDAGMRQSLVVRYGTSRDDSIQGPRDALPVLFVPAPFLQSQNIEILISDVASPDDEIHSEGRAPSNALLSPMARGSHSLVAQPVHCALLVVRGMDQMLTSARLLANTKFESKAELESLTVALDLPSDIREPMPKMVVLDVVKAEKALALVRESLEKAPEFEKLWVASGLPDVIERIASSATIKAKGGIEPALGQLIVSQLEAASSNLASQAEQASEAAEAASLTTASRAVLDDAISTFSQQGHAELQSGLAAAWSSRNWRKLAFWKLFWRVDDVPLILTNLVSTAWLPRTDRAIYELVGRLKQAGVSVTAPLPSRAAVEMETPQTVGQLTPEPVYYSTTSSIALASTAALESVSTPFIPASKPIPIPIPLSPPYNPPPLALFISSARQSYLAFSIATLTSSAQQIVLRALTLTGVSASLSALSFLSVTSGNLYESAAVFALGTAFALRRMQREWEAQCRGLEEGLMDEGRNVLRDTEESLRQAVADAAEIQYDEVETRMREEAEEAVRVAREELEKLARSKEK